MGVVVGFAASQAQVFERCTATAFEILKSPAIHQFAFTIGILTIAWVLLVVVLAKVPAD